MKRIKKILLMFLIIAPQLIVSTVKENQNIVRQSSMTSEDMKILRTLKKNDIIEKTDKGYQFIDYKKIDAKQVSKMRERVSSEMYQCLKEKNEITDNTYERMSDVSKVVTNYLLFVDGKSPMEPIEEFNKRLKKYYNPLNYLKKRIFIDGDWIAVILLSSFSIPLSLLLVGEVNSKSNIFRRKENILRPLLLIIFLEYCLIVVYPIKRFYILPMISLIINSLIVEQSEYFSLLKNKLFGKYILSKNFEKQLN